MFFILLLIFSFWLISPVMAWEVGGEVGVSSLNFHPDRTPEETSFSPYYLPVQYNLFVLHRLDENMYFDLSYMRDNILRNVLSGNFSYEMDYFSLQVGPFFGVGNSSEMPVKAGILASIELRSPGQVYLLIKSGRSLNLLNIFKGSALSGSISSKGDFLQESNEVRLGVYLRNTILSFYVQSKIFTIYTSTYGTVSDSQTDYGTRTEVFQKNNPFRVFLSFFFRNMTRYYEDLSSPTEHSIGSILFGTGLEYSYDSRWIAHIELESSIYSFGLNDLIGEYAGTEYLFTLRTGIRYRFDS
ncbi:MAG: hypothetical protein Kow009_06050 [Spirochaetales bacterium]